MASTNSTQYEKYLYQRDGDGSTATDYTPLDPTELAGRLRVAYFQHTCESEAFATSDTINLTVLPAGARVIDIIFCCEDISAGAATLTIGDSGDPDRLVASFDASGALAPRNSTVALRTPTTETPDIGFGYKYTAETVIYATVGGANLDTDNLWGAIFYVVD